jgi:hypothetical protein
MEGHLLEDLVTAYYPGVFCLRIPVCRKRAVPLSVPLSKTEILVRIKQGLIPLLWSLSPQVLNSHRVKRLLCSHPHSENVYRYRKRLPVLA